jgi:hypothetical protein
MRPRSHSLTHPLPTPKIIRRVLINLVFVLGAVTGIFLLNPASLGQEKDQSPPPKTKQNNLPVNWLYGAYVPTDVPLVSLTNSQRGQLYLRQTYLTWGIYFKTAFFAVIDQGTDSPPGWDGGAGAYGKD